MISVAKTSHIDCLARCSSIVVVKQSFPLLSSNRTFKYLVSHSCHNTFSSTICSVRVTKVEYFNRTKFACGRRQNIQYFAAILSSKWTLIASRIISVTNAIKWHCTNTRFNGITCKDSHHKTWDRFVVWSSSWWREKRHDDSGANEQKHLNYCRTKLHQAHLLAFQSHENVNWKPL